MTSAIPVLGQPAGAQDLGEVYEVVVGGQAERDIHVVLLNAAAPHAGSLRRRVDAMVGHGPTRLTGGVLVWSVDPDIPSELATPPDPGSGVAAERDRWAVVMRGPGAPPSSLFRCVGALGRPPRGRLTMAIADTPTELSEQVLEAVKTGEQSVLEAVRKFIDTVDQTLPKLGASPAWPQRLIDSGLEMAERLIQAQYDFLRNVVHSAGQSLGASPPGAEAETPNRGEEPRSPASGSKPVGGRSARPSRTTRPAKSTVGASVSPTA